MPMKHQSRASLLIGLMILLIAAFLRLYRLSEAPPGVAYDESQFMIDSLRVSQQGWFPSHNDTRAEPLNRYIQGLLMALAGRTIFTARMLSVFWGTLAASTSYQAAMSLLRRYRYRRVGALLAMGMMAVLVNPMTLSRFGDRGMLLPLATCAALHFLAQGWRRNSRWAFTLAGFFFFGAIHTYTAGVFFPAALIPILAHQAVFNWKAFRARLPHLPYILLGGLPALGWWVWQFSLPGPLYWRVSAIGYWEGRGYVYLLTQLPKRLWLVGKGIYLVGDCDPQFNIASKPLLNPVFFTLMLVGLAVSLWRFRRLETGVLLSLLPTMLLPLALTVDTVHGMRIGGEFIVVEALAAIGAITLLEGLVRLRPGIWATALTGLTLAALLAGTAADSFVSYFAYLEHPPEDATCNQSPMDPHFIFLSEHVALGAYLNNVQEPTYVPIKEMDFPATHLVLSQNFPQVRPFSALADPGEPLGLPDGQVVIWPGMERSAHYALLLPGGPPGGRGQIILLPGLPPDERDTLESRLESQAVDLVSPRGRVMGRRLELGTDFNPFRGLHAPEIDLIATYANGMQLVGVDAPFVIQPGETIDVTLYWRKGNWLPTDYYSGVTLIDAQGNALANSYDWIMRWVYATAQWRLDDTVPVGHTLTLPDDMPPGVYRLVVAVAAEYENPKPLNAVGPNGEPLGEFFPLNYLKAPRAEADRLPEDYVPTDVTIGELTLIGYTIEQDGQPLATLGEALPGGALTLTFYWQADERLPGNYHLFIHVQEHADGEVLSGFDGPPLGDAYPTIIWGPDELIATTHTITLPTGVGPLEFRIGLYEWPSLARLLVVQNGEAIPDNRAILWPEP